jgi:hypothetical protein
MSRRRKWDTNSAVSVELSMGASVTVTFEGNLFDLSQAERGLVADLSNVVQAFRDAQSLIVIEEAKKAAGA